MSALFYGAFTTHAKDAGPMVKLLTNSVLHVLWAGHEAVILFFVMSGFVLAIPYYNEKNGSYLSFFIKRIFRIYLPYLIALGIGIVLNLYFSSAPRIEHLSEWFNGFYDKPVTGSDVAGFMFPMQGRFHNVVTSLWSLPIELKVSLLFPFIAILFKRLSISACIAVTAANLVFYHIGKHFGFQSHWKDFGLFYYLTFFLVGALLSKYHQQILAYFEKLSKWQTVIVLLIAIVLYTYKWLIPVLPAPLLKVAAKIPADYVVCMASVLLLVLSISSSASALLNHKYLIELGKVSFSLYLLHPIVIGVVGFTLANYLPVYLLIILSVLLSLVISVPFHYYVEWPIQKLGRKFADKI
ncbi:acyltransferase [Filimonas lacunae]|nr:acyltransferase [Filimonas lacunae]